MDPINRKRGPQINVPLEKPKRERQKLINGQINNPNENFIQEEKKPEIELKQTLMIELQKAQKRIEELKVEEKRIKTRARAKELRKKSNAHPMGAELVFMSKRLSNTNRQHGRDHDQSFENQMNDYSFLKNSTLLEFFDQEEKQENEQLSKKKNEKPKQDIAQIRGLKQELIEEQQFLRQMMNSLITELKTNQRKRNNIGNFKDFSDLKDFNNFKDEDNNENNFKDENHDFNLNEDISYFTPITHIKHINHKLITEKTAYNFQSLSNSPAYLNINDVSNQPSPMELEGESLILNS